MEQEIVIPPDQVADLVLKLRAEGKKIVLTQGVFDLPHRGHIRYLKKAKSYGDILIVGIDSDALTRERKGPKRPIVEEAERIEVISELKSVDYITMRDVGPDINALTKIIKPDVLIISNTTGDYKDYENRMRTLVGEYCGDIVCLEPQAATSTTTRIRDLALVGGIEYLEKNLEFLYDFTKERGVSLAELVENVHKNKNGSETEVKPQS